MKTYYKIYNKVCLRKNLMLAFRKAKKGKSSKEYVRDFEANLDTNISKLTQELETFSYRPRPLKTFVIKDPKSRVISSSHFRDRIVHHALCNVIEPIFEKVFIHDSYANRMGKGTHRAIRRFERFKRKVSINGRLVKHAKNNNMVSGYFLKADIKHYFDTVDHCTMVRIIRKAVKDENVIWLVRQILSNHNGKIRDKGMPIGNLTSQLFANIYLNELDYFVKHGLKAKFYIRYMDDFIIFHKSEPVLYRHKRRIGEFLKTIKLEMHEEKSRVYPLHKGAGFLGYRIFYNYKLLKKSNIRTIYNRIEKFKTNYDEKLVSREKIMESLESWMSYARYANTLKLRRNLMKMLNKTLLEPHPFSSQG